MGTNLGKKEKLERQNSCATQGKDKQYLAGSDSKKDVITLFKYPIFADDAHLKCKKLAETAEAVTRELGIEDELEEVTELNETMKFGVMITPRQVVDCAVKNVGKIPSVDEVKQTLA